MEVTRELRLRAAMLGACSDGLPQVGATLADLSRSQLLWADEAGLLTAEELAVVSGGVPLWALSGCGDGYGSGYGDGSGSGDGDGDGSGSGSGDGYGYGDGYGSGDGDGDGSETIARELEAIAHA